MTSSRLVGRAGRYTLRGASVVVAAMALVACGSSSTTSPATTPSSGGSSPSGGAAAPSGSPIKIGVIGSVTGITASSENQFVTVAPAWAAWVNANGGIDGHPVKVYVVDDQSDAAKAQAAAEQLISSDGVIAIDVATDNLVSAFDGAAISQGVPLVSGNAYEGDWYTKTGMFPTPTGIASAATAYVQVGVQQAHAKKFALLYCAEVAACADAVPTMQHTASADGIGFSALSINGTAPSYTAQCLQLKQQGADYVQLNIGSTIGARLVKDCEAQGYNPTWGNLNQGLAPSAGFVGIKNITMYGPALSFPTEATAPFVQTYTDAMKTYAKGNDWHDGSSTFSWDAFQLLTKALKAAGPNPTRASLTDSLYQIHDDNLGGELANKVTYTRGKPLGFPFNPCYFLIELKNGVVSAPANVTPQCPTSP